MSHLRREFGMFFALAVMCLGLYVSNPDFLGQSNLVNTSRQIAMLGIFTVGMGFVIITGGSDLSVGSVIGLTGVIIARLSSSTSDGMGLPLWVGISVALAVALLIGLIQGLIITRLELQPFIVTLGSMLLLRGVSQTIVKGGTIGFGSSPFTSFADSGFLLRNGDPMISYPVVVFAAVIVLATYLLHFTVFGRYVYAIGGNRDAAAYSGINVKRVETTTYVISAGLAGVAGVCYAAYIGQMSQQVGIAYELYAIAAAVLGGCSLRGGTGTIIGIIIGSAMMRVIDNGINMFQFRYTTVDGAKRIWRLDPNWNFIIIGGVILAAIIIDQVAHMLQARRSIRGNAALSNRLDGPAMAPSRQPLSVVHDDAMASVSEGTDRQIAE